MMVKEINVLERWGGGGAIDFSHFAIYLDQLLLEI